MKAILDDRLFASGANSLPLVPLFDAALDARHRMEVNDEQGSHFTKWLAEQGHQTRDDILLAIERSREEESRAPSKRVVSVGRVATSDWTTRPPALSLADAKALLGLQFWILPENWSTDYGFLLAASTREQREELETWKKRGWLDLQNGGGLTDMCKRIKSIKASDPARALTMWVLFDSDARAAGKASPQSRELFGVCGKRIPFHQLSRRTIENYVPGPALERWTKRKRDTALGHRVEAFHAMPKDEQRHHFPMKHGLGSDENSKEGVNEALYGSEKLDQALRMRLRHGFGSDLRDVFIDEEIHITTADLIRDKSFNELNQAVTELLGWIK